MSRTTILVLFCLSNALAAQSSSRTYFVPASEQAPGGGCQSTTYRLSPAVGAGAVASSSASATYTLAGGFAANLGVGAAGKPWLAAVTPRFATLRGRSALTLHGAALDRGSAPTVTIGGRPAVLGTRTRDAITTNLPVQPAPGWQTVVIRNNLGTTVLPRGIGVLPMVMSDPAPASDVAFDLVFKGTKGDLVYWAVGVTQVAPIPVGGFHHGLGLHPAGYMVVAGFQITDSGGEARVPIPPTSYGTGTIYVQALFGSSDPGYAPGSFSNVLRI